MVPAKRDARIAGWLYFLFAAPGPFCLMYVPHKIIVRGDAAATAANLVAHEMLLRTSVVIWLLAMALWIVMAVMLYRVFNRVSKELASLLVIFVAVSVGIAFLNELNNLGAMLVLGAKEFAGPLTQPQREAVATLFLRLHGQGHAVNEMFWGLWLLPFGLLIVRSRFIPRLMGIWLLLDGFAWMVLSVVALLVPRYSDVAFKAAQPAVFAELAVMLWLIIVGVRAPATEPHAMPATAHD
ncbi:MAG TPA: DUF4386 domain-containing protein [Terriglobales bacterium]|nr:DUF4386 domain-containing protein [Terriglobales bacterium]